MAHETKDISDINEPDNPHTGTIYIVGVLSLVFVIGTFVLCAIYNGWMEEKNDRIPANTTQLEELRKDNAPKIKLIEAAMEEAVKAHSAK